MLTKPDRIQEGDEPSWIKFITHEEEPQSVGWFCVKQPSTMELKEKNVQEVVRAKEREFFEETSPWKDIPEKYRKSLGTQGVSDCLYESLVRLSAERCVLVICAFYILHFSKSLKCVPLTTASLCSWKK